MDKDIIYSSTYEEYKPRVFYANINNYMFRGYLVNISASALYFEPEDREGLIVVPHTWVKWCLPIEEAEEV